MTHGPERARLRQYLSGARHEATDAAGENWRLSGILLQETARHMRENAQRVRDGDGTDGGLSGVTAQAVLEALHASAASMQDKGTRLVAAGEVLNDAARVMRNAQTAEAAMADLQQPAAYSPPSYSPGYTPTPQEIQAEGDKRQAANQQMAAYSSARAQQEAAATEWTQKLDAVFLESIPTMQAIHGQPDPTEPPPSSSPSAPSSPTSPSVPLTPSTPGVPSDPDRPDPTKPDAPDPDKDPDTDRDQDKDQDKDRDSVPPRPPVIVDPLDPTHPITRPTVVPSSSTETTTVAGNQQSGVTYHGPQVSTPSSSGGAGGAGGINAAAFGAAGAAGGASGMMGGVRAGSASASAGSAPTRPIGATGRTGSAGALSRPAASSGSPAARSGTAGSPASRGATGGTAGRGGAGSAGARGAGSAGSRAAGSAGARGAGSAGGRGAASGSTSGSRSGGRKGDRDAAQERDNLVHDQDWLGDDDVAPGVLD